MEWAGGGYRIRLGGFQASPTGPKKVTSSPLIQEGSPEMKELLECFEG